MGIYEGSAPDPSLDSQIGISSPRSQEYKVSIPFATFHLLMQKRDVVQAK